MSSDFDVAIVGSGVVGVAMARELSLLGKSCVVLEKNSHVLSEASSGNTGHLATNFYYTAASEEEEEAGGHASSSSSSPLEYVLTRRAVTLNREWLQTQENVPRVSFKHSESNLVSHHQLEQIL